MNATVADINKNAADIARAISGITSGIQRAAAEIDTAAAKIATRKGFASERDMREMTNALILAIHRAAPLYERAHERTTKAAGAHINRRWQAVVNGDFDGYTLHNTAAHFFDDAAVFYMFARCRIAECKRAADKGDFALVSNRAAVVKKMTRDAIAKHSAAARPAAKANNHTAAKP